VQNRIHSAVTLTFSSHKRACPWQSCLFRTSLIIHTCGIWAGFEEHVHCRQSNVGLSTRASNGIRSIISTSIDRSEESSGTHCAIMGATRKRHWKGSCDNWINPRTCSSSSYVITIILAIDAVERAASSSLHAQRTRIWIQRNYCRGPKGSPSHPRLNGFTSHI